MHRLRWLITVPIAIVVVVFAVNNRGAADVDLWPLDLIVSWPLFVHIFLGAAVGFLAGAVLTRFSAASARRRKRAAARAALERTGTADRIAQR